MREGENVELTDQGLRPYINPAECEHQHTTGDGKTTEMRPKLSVDHEKGLQTLVEEAYRQCRAGSREDPTDADGKPTKGREECDEWSSVNIKGEEYTPVKHYWFEKVDLRSVAGAARNSFTRYVLGSSGRQAPKGFAPSGARFMRVGGFRR